ncbi:hypothetical protein JW930_03170 [Candidatus Woesearchaeota archaeon]|nr:hypothetical protein [Candidatus Woesearchaeota archaeon]
MVFYKTFPRETDKSVYPKWEEITLSDVEEKEQEIIARRENIGLMKECIDDAGEIMKQRQLKPFQTDMINIAIALFEKRASHQVYFKERKTKEKFEEKFSR